MKEDRPDSKTPPEPKPAPRMATPEEVQRFLDRAKRVLLLIMPTPSKLVH